MKNKNAFTLIELIVVVCIIAILAAMLIPAIQTAKRRSQEKQRTEQRGSSSTHKRDAFNLGDTVYIDGMDITGKVNQVYSGGTVDLLVKNTNGTLTVQERVNSALLKKVPQAESWR